MNGGGAIGRRIMEEELGGNGGGREQRWMICSIRKC